ncbi:hypothetical protein [Romboutsia sp.]|uniref:hypothetical protein n=1 Tax=Romboutsia sp. TaxID=1965302 RepID=UPI003F3F46D0
MINTKEKFNEAIASESIIKIRVFLDNCILWDTLNKKEIKEYVEILSSKSINGKPVFEKDNNIDLEQFKDTQEDLDNLYAESMLNYSKEKYLHRLKIADRLSNHNNKNTNISTENKSHNTATKTIAKTDTKGSVSNSKKKLALAALVVGVGAVVIYLVIKKLN